MGSQEWTTPADFWACIEREFDPFLDVCATSLNKKCSAYLGPDADDERESNGLTVDWCAYVESACWCNPGFGNVMPWMRKAIEECHRGAEVILLTHASHADWAQLGWQCASECRLLSPRIQFDPAPGIKRSSNARDGYLWVFRRYQRPDVCKISPWEWKGGANA